VQIDTRGVGSVGVQVVGTYTGVLSGQMTVDGTNWVTLADSSTFTRQSTGVASATITSGQQDIYLVTVVGAKSFRVTGLAAMTGVAMVSLKSKGIA
jgi:hypothetical protein